MNVLFGVQLFVMPDMTAIFYLSHTPFLLLDLPSSSLSVLFPSPPLLSTLFSPLTHTHPFPPPPFSERASKYLEELLASVGGMKVPVDNKAGDSDILRVIEAYCAGGRGAVRKYNP